MTNNVLIIGATSAIAMEVGKLYAKRKANLFLIGRNEERLAAVAQDLQVRGGNVQYQPFDLNQIDQHEALINFIKEYMPTIDVILIAHGSLPKQKICEGSFEATYQELMTNYLSTVSLLTYFANDFEKRKAGTIAVISSVAGDRGRQSNYIYGSAKGGLSIFLEGLRNRLTKFNVNVLTIKPGFVDTPMTQDFKKGLLWAKPDSVAKKIVSAIDKKQLVLYVPYFWKYIMCLIKSIPEKIFSKMSL
jgi:decaprenylphospho-beta-D-erythro-pentofuranosid-2-ulose 2-reductase